MERKEFLSKLGKGALFALSVSCMGSCSKSEENVQDTSDSESQDIQDTQQDTQDNQENQQDTAVDNSDSNTDNDSSSITDSEPSYDTDFTIDLEDANYASLQQLSAYVVKDGIVIAKSSQGDYVAATQTCSHQNNDAIYFTNKDQWQCEIHGARFDLMGNGLNSLASNGLRIYTTELSGTTLRVYG